MPKLTKMKCVAYRSDSPKVSEGEITKYREQVPEWNIVSRDGIDRLERIFALSDFVHALAFTNRVGALAEREDHHPAIVTEWGRVTVTWWTHKIRGLHRNDFVAAAKTDKLLEAPD